MTTNISRRTALGAGLAGLAATAASFVPARASANQVMFTWTTAVDRDDLNLGATSFKFTATDTIAANGEYTLDVFALNPNGSPLKGYHLEITGIDGKEPMVTLSVEHYSNGNAPQVESAMWDAKNLVDSSLNKTKSLDSVGVHNWMVNDAGWVRPDGSAVLTFTPFGTSNAC